MHTTVYSQQSLSQSDATIMIDDFVSKVLSTTGLAYKNRSDSAERGNGRLQSYRLFLPAMLNVFDGRVAYDFSEPLKLFNETRQEIRLVATGAHFTCPDPDDRDRYLSERECFNLLIKRIRKNGQDGRYARKLGDRAHDVGIQSYELREYVSAVMEVYPQTLVVRGTLRYPSALKTWFRVGDVFADRHRLLNLIASPPIFSGLAGYTLRIEQTEMWGFSIQTVFFFNAATIKSEACHALQLAEVLSAMSDKSGYWDNIGQDLTGWHEAQGRTTGLFDREETAAILRMAKAMTGLGRVNRSLRVMPERALPIFTRTWPSNQNDQAA